ncbi:MAG: hypothetical protein JJT77_09740 [Crocinitomicaceae bacterium]|jgi:hypothetical protein|nr:hypothetical protein [Crocinitomicaceae bacterium]
MKNSFLIMFLMLFTVVALSACGSKRAHCDAYGDINGATPTEDLIAEGVN